MSKQISLLLGSCLALQAGTFFGAGVSAPAPHQGELAAISSDSIPLYHREHAREILGQSKAVDWSEDKDVFADRSVELTQFINNKVRDLLPKPWRPKTSRIARSLIETANRYHMDPLFLMAMIKHESKFNPHALGSHGEIGLMQVKPETARWMLGDDTDISDAQLAKMLRNPETNIAIGTSFLARLRTRFKGRSELYITAYNMGAVNVNRHLSAGIRPTVYLAKVLTQYAALTEGFSDSDMADELLTTARQIASVEPRTLVVH